MSETNIVYTLVLKGQRFGPFVTTAEVDAARAAQGAAPHDGYVVKEPAERGWLVVPHKCSSCGGEKDLLSYNGKVEEESCSVCGGNMIAGLATPMVMGVSFVSGTQRDEAFELRMKKLKVQRDAYRQPLKKRGEHNAEMKELDLRARAASGQNVEVNKPFSGVTIPSSGG